MPDLQQFRPRGGSVKIESMLYLAAYYSLSCICSNEMWCFFSWTQVNIVPIIAKSDAISKSELAKFKIKITSELVSNGVQIYQFPTDDESVAEINSTMNVRLTTQVFEKMF